MHINSEIMRKWLEVPAASLEDLSFTTNHSELFYSSTFLGYPCPTDELIESVRVQREYFDVVFLNGHIWHIADEYRGVFIRCPDVSMQWVYRGSNQMMYLDENTVYWDRNNDCTDLVVLRTTLSYDAFKNSVRSVCAYADEGDWDRYADEWVLWVGNESYTYYPSSHTWSVHYRGYYSGEQSSVKAAYNKVILAKQYDDEDIAF